MTMHKHTARDHMRLIVEECVEGATGEVDLTKLATETAMHFGEDDENGILDDESHWIWEMAAFIADEHMSRGEGYCGDDDDEGDEEDCDYISGAAAL